MLSPRRRDERGAAAILVALVTCSVLFVVAALTVDVGNTWARRGQLQHQVDRAAKYAAEQLPVDTATVGASPTATQLRVAQAAAYYLACHGVPGQSDLSAIPACPAPSSYTSDTAITTMARTMLANGRSTAPSALGAVSFPATNQVAVTAPDARVTFGFGRVVGKDGSTQRKSATAVVLSPGEILPVGMSLTCLANTLGTAPLGAGDTASRVMPVNYVSSGFRGQVGTTTDPTTTAPYFGDIQTQGNSAQVALNTGAGGMSNPVTPDALSGLSSLSFTWGQTKSGYTPYRVSIFVRKAGYTSTSVTGSYVQTQQSPYVWNPVTHTVTLATPLANPYSFTLALPAGNYEAMIQLEGINASSGNTATWANLAANNAHFTVSPQPLGGDLRNTVSCSRPLQSPHQDLATDSAAMVVDLAQGLDHALAAFPGLGDAVDAVHVTGGSTVGNVATLLGNPSAAFACGSNPAVKRDYPTRRTDGANCVHVDTATDWSAELTQGLLTGGTFATGAVSGRLRCPSSGACNHSSTRAVLTDPGGIAGRYNDDHFSDFALRDAGGSARYLSDPFLMSLDLFVSPTLPLVTPPNDSVDPALYASPRFFWAPVVVSAYTTGAAGDYPVMAFRPVFLTSDASSQVTTPVDLLLLDLITQSTTNGLTLAQTLTKFGQTAACLASPTTCELALLGLADVSTPLATFLGANTVTVGGLVIDRAAARVRAARIMTLAPGALPAVPRAYAGPTTDYLGVGPRIVRLVR